MTRVKGNAESGIKRSLLAFSRDKRPLVQEELIIELERHVYTGAYIELTREFYLKM
jgi:tRNA1Val (adenine37-N6)-methyltransferase